MLTGKQKRYLRSEAHHLNAIFQVGKDGVTSNQVKGIIEALDSQELMKVKLLESCPDDVHSVALELSVQTKSEVVQIIGHTIVLYKSSDKGIYKLP
ncbi:ribosome assembly RNA-binding protein YhbY [Candidatus Stoquefichus massiliensis]|uniref:ribosome assembly RNA-binding protein YhbY n=1 Tax=Candidatus Stoquefichus massiliensis TaxID=1470350 RepID=UPI000486E225|nr:ribosome assembly RNA-binding protein YhbY [Candidatus Stoquefichus massiliensis]